MNTLTITVRGTPAAQGSKRGFVNRATGRVTLVEQSERVKPWREAVRAAALDALAAVAPCVEYSDGTTRRLPGYPFPDVPLAVHATFVFDRPSGHYGSGRNASVLRQSAPAYPGSRPDLDKCLRALLDALAGTLLRNDSRVVDIAGRKVYAGTGAPLPGPGAVVHVMPLPATIRDAAMPALDVQTVA